MMTKLVQSVIANSGVGRDGLHDPNLNKIVRLDEAKGSQGVPE